MKNSILLLFFTLFTLFSLGQGNAKDSLKLRIEKEQQDTVRVMLLANFSKAYKDEKPETGITYGLQALVLAKKIRYIKGEAYALNALGNNFRMIGDYTKGLKFHFDALKIFESQGDLTGAGLAYHGIAANYEDMGDYREALKYGYKAMSIAESARDMHELMILQGNMGNSFEGLNQLDSALHYEQSAYEISLSTKDFAPAGTVLARLGKIHMGLGNYSIANDFYHTGIGLAITNMDNNALNELYIGLARLFQLQNKTDSSIFYARKSLGVGRQINHPYIVVTAATFLYGIYSHIKLVDSGYKYLMLATQTKDTLITQSKLKQIQLLAFEERTREQEIREAAEKAQAERKRNIQYLAIGIAIITILILFPLFSFSAMANSRWIKFLSIVALLIVFEFINLLVHPYLMELTGDSPILMLLALVAIAALLVPLHHKIEVWVTAKMIEKNKAIRLTAARKTIQELEK